MIPERERILFFIIHKERARNAVKWPAHAFLSRTGHGHAKNGEEIKCQCQRRPPIESASGGREAWALSERIVPSRSGYSEILFPYHLHCTWALRFLRGLSRYFLDSPLRQRSGSPVEGKWNSEIIPVGGDRSLLSPKMKITDMQNRPVRSLNSFPLTQLANAPCKCCKRGTGQWITEFNYFSFIDYWREGRDVPARNWHKQKKVPKGRTIKKSRLSPIAH